MSLFALRTTLLPQLQKPLQFIRYKSRINIQRPRAPHYERARVIKVCKPFYMDPRKGMSLADLCEKPTEVKGYKEKEENPYQKFLAREVLNWFNHSKMVAFYHSNPITNEDRWKAWVLLKKQNMILKRYGKKVISAALENTNYEAVLKLFTSHNIIVFSPEIQVGKLLKLNKKFPQLVLMAGIVDGKLLSYNELVKYSNVDITTAQSGLVTLLNSAAMTLQQHLICNQQTLIGHLQKHIELQNDSPDSSKE